jgi:hypothetical protein
MKRSEFYAMFITMIVLFTASMSWAVSYQPQIIQPTKAAHIGTSFAGVNNTYYTLVDITGIGILSNIRIGSYLTDISSSKQVIKITIDGGTPIEIRGADAADNYAVGHITTVASGAGKCTYSFNYPCLIYFKTSLKIEVKHDVGSELMIFASADYSIQ